MRKQLLFIPAILLLAASCNSSIDNKTRFGTEADCEAKTGMFCVKVLCDYVPPGKTYKDVCPYGQGYYESSGTTLEDYKKQQAEQYNRNAQTSSSTQSAVQTPNWKDMVLGEFGNLADWQQTNLSDWRFADDTYNTQHRTQLKKYGTEKILLLSKSFNANTCQSDCQAEGIAQNNLETAVKTTLSQNGWKAVSWPSEPGFYSDYLYVKDGHPLILQIGTRDAVTGGMYIRIEFQY